MPNVRKLTAEEVQTVERGKPSQRKQVEALYDAIAAQFGPGEWGEVNLAEGEIKPTVRSNVRKAFMRRGLDVTWKRGTADTLKFRVAGDLVDDYDPNAESFHLPEPNGSDLTPLQEIAVGADIVPVEQIDQELDETERLIQSAREAAEKAAKKPRASTSKKSTRVSTPA